MTESENPYVASSTADLQVSSRFSPSILFAAGLWLVIAVGVTASRYFLLPIYSDFAVELPAVTLVLIHPVTVALFVASSIGIPLIALAMPSSQSRNRAALVAILLAIPTGVICIFGLLVPLLKLIITLA